MIFSKQRCWLWVIPLVFFTSGQSLHAGTWTLKRGQLWVKSSFFIQRTSDRYTSTTLACGGRACRNGERAPFFFNGKIELDAAYLDIWYGLTDRVELQFQLPYFDIRFKDDVNPFRPGTSDIGDTRFGVRYRLPVNFLAATVRVGAKAPTGFFNKDAEVVPVGDGQWDLELSADVGKSLWPLPAYVNVTGGYKLRFEPDVSTTNLDPGNELTLRVEAGVNIQRNLLVKAAIDGFWGQEFTALFADSKLKLRDSERRILYFEPGVLWTVLDPLTVEFGVRFSLSGKNYPAGQIFSTGLSYKFDF